MLSNAALAQDKRLAARLLMYESADCNSEMSVLWATRECYGGRVITIRMSICRFIDDEGGANLLKAPRMAFNKGMPPPVVRLPYQT